MVKIETRLRGILMQLFSKIIKEPNKFNNRLLETVIANSNNSNFPCSSKILIDKIELQTQHSKHRVVEWIPKRKDLAKDDESS